MTFRDRNGIIKQISEVNVMELRDKRLFLLDMDGTIYLDEGLFFSTQEAIVKCYVAKDVFEKEYAEE